MFKIFQIDVTKELFLQEGPSGSCLGQFQFISLIVSSPIWSQWFLSRSVLVFKLGLESKVVLVVPVKVSFSLKAQSRVKSWIQWVLCMSVLVYKLSLKSKLDLEGSVYVSFSLKANFEPKLVQVVPVQVSFSLKVQSKVVVPVQVSFSFNAQS